MIKNTNQLRDYKIMATDGECGNIKDFYFDDRLVSLKYIVVDTNNWLSGQKILLNPSSFISNEPDDNCFKIIYTKDKIKSSPLIKEHQTVSREIQKELSEYYSWFNHHYDNSFNNSLKPEYLNSKFKPEYDYKENLKEDENKNDTSLRSTNEVKGYIVESKDGEVGLLDDFLIDTSAWRIIYLTINAKNFQPSQKLLVSLNWLDQINWSEKKIIINLTSEEINHSPNYDSSEKLSIELEKFLSAEKNIGVSKL